MSIYQNLFCTGNSCIDQIALQHYIVIHQNRHDHDRIFGALCFMYRCRIGMHQFIQLRCFIFYDVLVKIYFQRPFLQIYTLYGSNISVKNFFFIIISDLHDFIPGAKQISTPAQTVTLWIQGFLKCKIQIEYDSRVFCNNAEGCFLPAGQFPAPLPPDLLFLYRRNPYFCHWKYPEICLH